MAFISLKINNFIISFILINFRPYFFESDFPKSAYEIERDIFGSPFVC